MRNAYNLVVVKSEGKTAEDLGIDGRILLKLILKKQGVRVWS
jgi:hypothetical protein